MKISLARNISKYRKEKSMTQEELAEVLGVTFAAVSKWERGVATPDINYIVLMASLFDISLDALIGYEVIDSKIDDLEKNIENLIYLEKYDDILDITKNLLLKYPNNFKSVHLSGKIYYFLGIKLNKKEFLLKCIPLLEKSILLLNQNDNDEINEITIWGEIAICYMKLDDIEKSIQILKKYNVSGLYDPIIAYSYTSNENYNLSDVESHLNNALTNTCSNMVLISISYSNLYIKLKKYDKSLESLFVLIHLLNDLKKDQDKLNYFDKIIAYLYANCGLVYYLSKDENNSIEYLNKAYDIAKKYDLNPQKKIRNTKLYTDDFDDLLEDSLGKTAIEAIDNFLKNNDCVYKIWNDIKEKRL